VQRFPSCPRWEQKEKPRLGKRVVLRKEISQNPFYPSSQRRGEGGALAILPRGGRKDTKRSRGFGGGVEPSKKKKKPRSLRHATKKKKKPRLGVGQQTKRPLPCAHQQEEKSLSPTKERGPGRSPWKGVYGHLMKGKAKAVIFPEKGLA